MNATEMSNSNLKDDVAKSMNWGYSPMTIRLLSYFDLLAKEKVFTEISEIDIRKEGK